MRTCDGVARIDGCPSLGRMLEDGARLYLERPALFIDGGVVTYAALNDEADWWARALAGKLHVRPGERVAILLANSRQFIAVFFAGLKAGAAVVPLNTFLTAPELKHIVEDSGASVLVTSDAFAPAVRKFSGEVPSLRALVTVGREDLGGDTWLHEELVKGLSPDPVESRAGRDDLAVVIYTSGTTGKPKGAMLTHGNILSNVAGSVRAIEIGPRDRVLLMLPMFHSFTITACMLMPLAVGASIVAVCRLPSLAALLRSVIRLRATVFIAIPHIYDVMAERGVPRWLRLFMRVRVCVSGSAPLSEATLRAFERRVRIPLLEGYGLSETSPVVSINPLRGERKPGSVGQPIPGVSVSIVSGDGATLPAGEIGEIAVRGPNVMAGYLNRPRETKETIRNGWLLTGDIGKMDGDGYIYILDRKKDMILFHGMNVYPREIEEVLYGHPAVAEAAVVGKPDRRRGEVPVAFVSLREGARVEPRELIRHCAGSLAGYKVPHRITVLGNLPRNPAGKVMKRALKEALAFDN